MARVVESRQLLYVFTSAHVPAAAEVAGTGVVVKTPRRHTLRKTAGTALTTDRVVAAYEAIKAALKEAHEMGARAVIVYTDSEVVVKQLDRQIGVEPQQLARHLETRSLLNQFHRAEVILISPDNNVAAHDLALEATEHGRSRLGEAMLELPLMWAGTGTG